MCGITGFIDFNKNKREAFLKKTVTKMCDAISHRGPDGSGIYCDKKMGLALGHRRLSIIDLSKEGAQPMDSISSRYTIVYNGEVYNFDQIRSLLIPKGYKFRGHSDTEIILAGIEEWGINQAVKMFNGMFAIALYDRKEKKLILVRDRMGIKPLYYGWSGDNFLFGSELKALKSHPQWQKNINRDVLTLYVRYNYIPAPYTIYHDIYKLIPGTILTIDLTNKSIKNKFSPHTSEKDPNYCKPMVYWSPKEVFDNGQKNRFEGTESQAVDTLDKLLQSAVSKRMVADVPVGAFLSGGIDSSLIVALMQSVSNKKIRTFTIGFEEKIFDESPYAKAVATHLGTEHTQFNIKPNDLLDVIPKLVHLYDEPFADSSQIPTYIVSKLIREQVTVALSGDGGDEQFAGYERFFITPILWKKINLLPLSIRSVICQLMKTLPLVAYEMLFKIMNPVLPGPLKTRPAGDSINRILNVLGAKSQDDAYSRIMSFWQDPSVLVPNTTEPLSSYTSSISDSNISNFSRRNMLADLTTYMVDDILVKVDRASMGVGLETRVPLLDHRITEFTTTLPIEMLIKNGQGKHILKEVLYRYLPKELFNRTKKGFTVPVDNWIRGPLEKWAESLLDPSKIKKEGFFDPNVVNRIWNEHKTKRRTHKNQLWAILMFESWLQNE
jgi:asparagine synthase (glutamine-hydrolysing)